MSRKLLFWLAAAGLVLVAFLFFRFSAVSTSTLWRWSGGGQWLLPLIAVAALLDSINPCAFSILLLTIAFLFSLGRARGRILELGLVYILGLFVVYFLIGLGLLRVLHLFDTPHFMAKLGAWIMIVVGGLNLINEVWPAFPIKLKIPQVSHGRMATLIQRASLPAIFLLGTLVGLCEFPCTGGPYLMAVGLLRDQTTYWTGFGYLLLYNLIFILPLVIILALASQPALLERVQTWRRQELPALRWGGALAMIAFGVLILWL